MFHMMSYREKRQKKSRMASAIIDLQGPVKEMEKVPTKEALNTTYEITDESMGKFKSELEQIMKSVNRIPVTVERKADHTIVESCSQVKNELSVLDDLIRNIEQWKDKLIANEALPINLLVSLTVSVSWLLRCKAELTKTIDNLCDKSKELTNDYLLNRSRELSKSLLDKITENAVLKAVESENDKLKKEARSLAIAQRFARLSLKLGARRDARRRNKASREGSSYSRYSSITSRRTTPASAMRGAFGSALFEIPKKEEHQMEPDMHQPTDMKLRQERQVQNKAYSSFTTQLLDEEPYIWKASKHKRGDQNTEDKASTVFAAIPSQVIDNFKPSNYILAPFDSVAEKLGSVGGSDSKQKENNSSNSGVVAITSTSTSGGDSGLAAAAAGKDGEEESALARRESFLNDLKMVPIENKNLSGSGNLVCEGLHGLAEKQTYTRQEVLEARIKHAKQLHQLQEIFEQRIQSVNAYYQEIISSQSS